MQYDFSSLSPKDFESLACDLFGREIDARFESFAEGPDGGIDGRHVDPQGTTILQAKHYGKSGLSNLKSTMKKERDAIDALSAQRYVLVTSLSLTPKAKDELKSICGPSVLTTGDILGQDDLNALLRKYPDIEKAHVRLWQQSTVVMKSVVTEAVEEALDRRGPPPPALVPLLLPTHKSADNETEPPIRDVLFFIKSSPIDDDFVLWLGPKLEAQGYQVFADVLTLQPGDKWRREVNQALQARAAKVLLISRGETLADPSVQDEIDIAVDLAERLGDPRFIIPLRLENAQRVKGVGDAIPVDFVRGWGEGLSALATALQRQKVPRTADDTRINPNWEVFRRRGAIPLVNEPERLTSNWLRITDAPDHIRCYEASGALNEASVRRAIALAPFPLSSHGRGFVCFATPTEVDDAFQDIGRFKLLHEMPLLEFVENGSKDLSLRKQPAANMVTAMLKDAWFRYCNERGFIRYLYSESVGFHASAEQAPVGKHFSWGRQGDRRSSMLRNIAKGHIWQFGVTAWPASWPFWHFKLKARVLFAADDQTAEGKQIDDHKKMHRLRRSVCKGWRNKQWHGRMLAFLELLSGEAAYIRLKVSPSQEFVVDASPILFSSPVSTYLPDELGTDDEELDPTTLGRPDPDVEEDK